MKRYLLDTNVLIALYETDPSNDAHVETLQRVHTIRQENPEAEFFITPLIRYETLRGVKSISIEEMSEILDGLDEIEIKRKHAKRAAEIWRLAKEEGHPMEKRNFDVFHFVCAEQEGLELLSKDAKDMPLFEKLLQKQH